MKLPLGAVGERDVHGAALARRALTSTGSRLDKGGRREQLDEARVTNSLVHLAEVGLDLLPPGQSNARG
jgi:hypothetical protein